MIGKDELADAVLGHFQDSADPPEHFKELEVDEGSAMALMAVLWESRAQNRDAMDKLSYSLGYLDGLFIGIKATYALTHKRCTSCGDWLDKPEDFEKTMAEMKAEILEQAIEAAEREGFEYDPNSTEVRVDLELKCADCAKRLMNSMNAANN